MENHISFNPEKQEHVAVRSLLIRLMKKPVFRNENSEIWNMMKNNKLKIENIAIWFNLKLVFNETDGYAYFKWIETDEDVPKLATKSQLNCYVSYLLAVLRNRLLDFESSGRTEDFHMFHSEIKEICSSIMPANNNEVKRNMEMEKCIQEVCGMGFLKQDNKDSDDCSYEVRKIIKSFIDFDWIKLNSEKLNSMGISFDVQESHMEKNSFRQEDANTNNAVE